MVLRAPALDQEQDVEQHRDAEEGDAERAERLAISTARIDGKDSSSPKDQERVGRGHASETGGGHTQGRLRRRLDRRSQRSHLRAECEHAAESDCELGDGEDDGKPLRLAAREEHPAQAQQRVERHEDEERGGSNDLASDAKEQSGYCGRGPRDLRVGSSRRDQDLA